jgi:hypothetical protein
MVGWNTAGKRELKILLDIIIPIIRTLQRIKNCFKMLQAALGGRH